MEPSPYLLTQWNKGLQGSGSILFNGFSDSRDYCAQQSRIWKFYINIDNLEFIGHVNEIH